MTSFRSDTRDRAIALAKRWGHEEVELRHILVAIALELQREPEIPVDRLLEPRGVALGPPHLSETIETLLDRCKGPKDAADVLDELRAELAVDLEFGTALQGVEMVQERDASTVEVVAPEQQRGVNEVLDDLDNLIGLGSVKGAVADLVHLHRLNNARVAERMRPMPVGLNLVFTGSPGTGKTTVARLVADLYRTLNLLPRGHLVEVHRADLVAGYVGQTALQVERVVNNALGGVLFIDEAYALASPGQHDYGSEAVSTLVKLMEDKRDKLAVIVAGYPAPMESFIRSNPGLRSRFQRFVHFPDYNVEDLDRIFSLMASRYQIELAPGVTDRIKKLIEESPSEVRSGNARFVRNILEIAYGRMAARANEDGVIESHELSLMVPEDVPSNPPKATDDEVHGQYL